ncbi:MAG: ABC transporter ATP-binding protein [Gemmatimonadaceae bacterium]
MLPLVRHLLALFSARERLQLGCVLALNVTSALVEAVGVALIPAYVALLNSPSAARRFLLSHHGEWLVRGGDAQMLVRATVALALFFVVKNVYLAGMMYLQRRFVAERQIVLSKRLLHRYLLSPYTFHLTRNTAELLRIINSDVNQVFTGVLLPLLILVSEALIVSLVAALLFGVDPLSSGIALAVIAGATGAYYRLIRSRLSTLGGRQQRNGADLIKWVNQGLGGIKETKVLGREAFFLDAYGRSVREWVHATSMLQMANDFPRYLIETIAMCGMAVATIVMVASGRDLQSILPRIALFAVAALRLMPSMNRIVNAATYLRYYGHAVEVVYRDIADSGVEESHGTGGRVALTDAIELYDVTYKYPDANRPSVSDVSLTIPRGASVGFVGASGAGKTTVIDVILGLLRPTSGAVLVDGVDIDVSVRDWQRSIGYIPQTIYLSDDTLRRNVAFGLEDSDIDDAAVWRALAAAQLDVLVRSLPLGLDTFVGERGVRISGGQRQRVGIARALYHDPDVLVMDEATAALDHRTEREITDVLHELHGAKTMIIIAHRLSTVRRCDTLFVMADGEVVEKGAYDDLVQSSAVFQGMVG